MQAIILQTVQQSSKWFACILTEYMHFHSEQFQQFVGYKNMFSFKTEDSSQITGICPPPPKYTLLKPALNVAQTLMNVMLQDTVALKEGVEGGRVGGVREERDGGRVGGGRRGVEEGWVEGGEGWMEETGGWRRGAEGGEGWMDERSGGRRENLLGKDQM